VNDYTADGDFAKGIGFHDLFNGGFDIFFVNFIDISHGKYLSKINLRRLFGFSGM
jgi:hypothetical protein